MKIVYPWMVPAESITAASRGTPPRDNFRVVTKDEDEPSELVQTTVQPGSVDQGPVREEDWSLEQTGVEPAP
jgi:hypothetical protein